MKAKKIVVFMALFGLFLIMVGCGGSGNENVSSSGLSRIIDGDGWAAYTRQNRDDGSFYVIEME